MKTYEIKEQGFTLKKAITEGKVSPAEVVDAVVWAHVRKLEIRLNDSLKDSGSLKEAVVFFWDYTSEKPFVIREVEVRDNRITLEQDKTLMLQMQILEIESVRVAVAFRFERSYFCGYVRNNEAKNEELQPIERSICKLAESDEMAFVAYWTESGILSVKNRYGQRFDEEFYRARLSEYYWEIGKLVAYLETPLTIGEAQINMLSVSTNTRCADAVITPENVTDTGLKRIWKLTVDLSDLSAEDSNGYRLLCTLGVHSFEVYFDGETDDDALCKVTLKSGETLDVCVVKEKSGRIILKTGKIYPVMLSVVTAVYNTAPFLAEMINSVLSQDVSELEKLREDYRSDYYQDIFEFILVDDGSTDGSADILDDYAQISDRIRVIHKENGGVSSARNAGIDIARGKYITFPDSDDKLSDNVLQVCFNFFEEHENEICMVTYPLRFFDAQTGDHWTNYRFKKGTRILDLQHEWDNPQYFTNATFFKTAFIKNQIFFDTNLINGEDMKFNYEVMYHNTTMMGLVNTCVYWYRRRSSGEQSAIQQSRSTEKYYIPYITDLLGWLYKEANKVYGKIPKYVQYTVMGQLQWRLRTDGDGKIAKSIIGEDGFREYKRLINELIKQIDIDVLMGQKQLFREHLFYLGKVKTDNHPQRIREGENISYYFEDHFCSEAASCFLQLDFMTIDHGVLRLDGSSANLEPDCENWVLIGNSKRKVEIYEGRNSNKKTLGEVSLYVEPFKVEIPLEAADTETIYFGSTIDGTDVIKTRIVLGKFMPISNSFSKSYYSEGNWTIRLDKNKLSIWNMASLNSIPDFEKEFENQILQKNKGNDSYVQAVEIRRQAINRMAWNKKDKQIWLISDRYRTADDNGEALFEYLAKKKDLPANVYFVIAEDSKDYGRLSKLGKVVVQDSAEHMILHLTADCIISSQADEYIIDPAWRKGDLKNVYKDLYCRKKFIFLQHGITKDDLSAWLNRYNKNIDGFVCAAYKEAQSIRDYDYFYDKQVWLTGFPRYDRLYHNEKKYITVMPTWRKWLMQDFNSAESDSDATKVKDDITDTEFFQFYNSLLNDTELLNACDKYGYTLCFMPHTNLRKSIKFFDQDKRVLFFDFDKTYRDAFAEADLLITDYSSTAMDFAYLKKPVVYVQFDKERFFSGEHTYQQGYFEYEQDGFGEVVYDRASLVKEMISYMQTGCQLKKKYQERIADFFAYNDRDNCQRVYEKIADLTGIFKV